MVLSKHVVYELQLKNLKESTSKRRVY